MARKQSLPLTRAYLDQALKPLKDDVAALKGDVGLLKASMVTSDDLDRSTDEIRGYFSKLQSSVDGFMKTTKDTETELKVLRHSHSRLQALLIKKGIITNDELAAA